MEKDYKRIPAFDDIVFENRNREYGAFVLRKKYNRNVSISLLAGVILIGVIVIAPYLNAKVLVNDQNRSVRQVEIKMENLDQPAQQVAPPPPPPPVNDIVRQQEYIPPVVVDSVNPEENKKFMTADEAQIEVKNADVIEVQQEVKEEVAEADTKPEPFYVVEEMPEFPGGDRALLQYVSEKVVYPEIARENNIQGKVIIKFCVTPSGGVDLVTVLKGVDPELDAEVVRVVKTLPSFKPGRQGGRPVPVWYTIPFNFQIK